MYSDNRQGGGAFHLKNVTQDIYVAGRITSKRLLKK
jgi:hypothetical protein